MEKSYRNRISLTRREKRVSVRPSGCSTTNLKSLISNSLILQLQITNPQ